jgi:hypothetical protein
MSIANGAAAISAPRSTVMPADPVFTLLLSANASASVSSVKRSGVRAQQSRRVAQQLRHACAAGGQKA